MTTDGVIDVGELQFRYWFDVAHLPGWERLPCTPPRRAVAAVAAGAGVHAEAVWEVLDPDWAEVRRLLRRGARRFTIGDPESLFAERRFPHNEVCCVTAGAVDASQEARRHRRWGTRCRRAATTAAGEVGWLTSRRVARTLTALHDTAVRDPLLIPVTIPWWAATVGAAALEQPELVAATMSPTSDHTHVGLRRWDVDPTRLRVADVWAAVLGARLAAHGPNRLRIGLRLADGGGWGLHDIVEATAELA